MQKNVFELIFETACVFFEMLRRLSFNTIDKNYSPMGFWVDQLVDRKYLTTLRDVHVL